MTFKKEDRVVVKNNQTVDGYMDDFSIGDNCIVKKAYPALNLYMVENIKNCKTGYIYGAQLGEVKKDILPCQIWAPGRELQASIKTFLLNFGCSIICKGDYINPCCITITKNKLAYLDERNSDWPIYNWNTGLTAIVGALEHSYLQNTEIMKFPGCSVFIDMDTNTVHVGEYGENKFSFEVWQQLYKNTKTNDVVSWISSSYPTVQFYNDGHFIMIDNYTLTYEDVKKVYHYIIITLNY